MSLAFSSPYPVSEELEELFRSEVLICNERQQHFKDILDKFSNNSCVVDFTTGTMTLGEDEFVIKNIQFLGSWWKHTNTWLWSWSTQTFDGFPEEVLEDAIKAKEFGERHNIIEFTSANNLLINQITALALAMVSVNVVGADAYYPIDIHEGEAIAFICIRDERLTLPAANNWRSFIISFPKLISSVIDTYPNLIVDQLKMITDYCSARRYIFKKIL